MRAQIWQPGSYGAKKRHWFVWRHPENSPQEHLADKRGRTRWFASYEAAKRAADNANRQLS